MDSPTVQSSAAESEKDAAGRSSFLSLPAEIRNKIYRYSLVEDPSTDRINGLGQPALVRTNKQIRSEALPIYYGENRFHLTIPSPSSKSNPDDWADFIRMFRVFKAGRSGGRGTGSLRFLQDLMCRMTLEAWHTRLMHWELKVMFVAASKRRGGRKGRGSKPGGVPVVAGDGPPQVWPDRDSVYACVRSYLTDGYPDSIMRRPCVNCLISTILMVANECIDITERVGFRSAGQPRFFLCGSDDEDFDFASEDPDYSAEDSDDSEEGSEDPEDDSE